jgi:hypothetical protein
LKTDNDLHFFARQGRQQSMAKTDRKARLSSRAVEGIGNFFKISALRACILQKNAV